MTATHKKFTATNMPTKVLYFDVETTGRNWFKHDIVQLGLIIEVDGEVKEEKNFRCQPFSWDEIDQEAMDVTGLTLEDLKSYPTPQSVHQELLAVLGKYVDKYDKADKYYPAGYNVDFDINFLGAFFRKNDDNFIGSWLNWKKLDPLPLLFMEDFAGRLKLENYKLGTVAAHFGIELDAHDAFSDIRATRQLLLKLLDTKKTPT